MFIKEKHQFMHREIAIDSEAKILRDKFTKNASLDIITNGVWRLYAGTSFNSIDLSTPVLEGQGSGVFPINVDSDKRIYFKLVIPNDGCVILLESQLPMEGGYNFRDMGGIPNVDGRRVKWGMLFRADDLSELSDSDLLYLESIPVTSVIDFRAIAETRRTPDRLPVGVRFTYPISISRMNLTTEGVQSKLEESNMDMYMKSMYRQLISDPVCVKAYRTFFKILQHRLSAPIVFHCSAGKDRTGMAAALILYALGVDEKIIMEDYLASRVYLADKYQSVIARFPRSESMFTVKKSFLQAGINQMKREHGSVEAFLTNVLNVNLDRMKDMYLY